MYLVQLPIAFLIFMVLAFGIGFIINMLIKTTWLPIYVYVLIVGFILFKIGKFGLVDIVVLLGGLLGAVLSAVTIRILRTRGYSMF